MHLADFRLYEHHGSFQKSESRKWSLTGFGSKGVLTEGHRAGRQRQVAAHC